MYERLTSLDRVVASALWAVTVATYLAAGVLLLHGWGYAALFVAEIACGLSAAAAAMQIRGYAIRACELVRNTCSSQQHDNPGPTVPLQRVH